MRFVLDTNQAAQIHRVEAPPDLHPLLFLPPLTWAEILSGPAEFAIPRLRAIAQYDVQFGWEIDDIYEKLRQLPEDEIAKWDTALPRDSVEHKQLLGSLWSPHEQFIKAAQAAKRRVKQFSANAENRLAHYQRQNQIKKSKGESLDYVHWKDLNDAQDQLFLAKNAPVRTEFIRLVTKDDTKPLNASSPDAFFDAVLENGMLRRFLFLYVTILFGYSDCWEARDVNVGVSQRRDDVPDISLALYARDGDVVLTSDKKLRRAFRFADPNEAVKLSTWDELIAPNG